MPNYTTTPNDVVNTTAETDVLDYAIPANAVDAQDYFLHLPLIEFFNSSGANNQLTIRLYVAGQTYTLMNSSRPSNGNVTDELEKLWLVFTGAQSNMTVRVCLAENPFSGAGPNNIVHTFTGVDTTSAFDIKITGQWGTADANSQLNCFAGKLIQYQ